MGYVSSLPRVGCVCVIVCAIVAIAAPTRVGGVQFHFRGNAIDTRHGAKRHRVLPQEESASRSLEHFVLRFGAPSDDPSGRSIPQILVEDLKITHWDYVADGTVMVFSTEHEVVKLVNGNPRVQWSDAMHPEWKHSPHLDRALSRRAMRDQDIEAHEVENVELTVHLGDLGWHMTRTKEDTQKLVHSWSGNQDLQARFQVSSAHRVGVLVPSHRASDALAFLRAEPEVYYVTERPKNKLFNDKTSRIIQGNSETRKQWRSGLTGEGEIVGVADTGFDWKTCWFYDTNLPNPPFWEDSPDTGIVTSNHRKIIAVDQYRGLGTNHNDTETNGMCSTTGCAGPPSDKTDYTDVEHGHGTHVAGTVAGKFNGVNLTAAPAWAGMAPDAKLFLHDIAPGAPDSPGAGIGLFAPQDLQALLFGRALKNKAFIHTNSWGSLTSDSQAEEYSIQSFDTDKFLWDNPEMLILFAAGNAGQVAPSLVAAPANAKNVLSVGASGLNVASGVLDDSMAKFSSYGPVLDGRVKPDVVAPGTFLLSAGSRTPVNGEPAPATSQASCVPSSTSLAYTSSGTSMATPATAGAAALVRQYLRKITDKGIFDGVASLDRKPYGQLIKALMIASANKLSYQDVITEKFENTVPAHRQGWGRIDLNNILNLDKGRIWFNQHRNSTWTDYQGFYSNKPITTTHKYCIEHNGGPLKVVLYWHDYPAAVGATTPSLPLLMTDLDLLVHSSSQSVRGNMYENGTYDYLHNTEMVYIQDAAKSKYQITVRVSPRQREFKTPSQALTDMKLVESRYSTYPISSVAWCTARYGGTPVSLDVCKQGMEEHLKDLKDFTKDTLHVRYSLVIVGDFAEPKAPSTAQCDTTTCPGNGNCHGVLNACNAIVPDGTCTCPADTPYYHEDCSVRTGDPDYICDNHEVPDEAWGRKDNSHQMEKFNGWKCNGRGCYNRQTKSCECYRDAKRGYYERVAGAGGPNDPIWTCAGCPKGVVTANCPEATAKICYGTYAATTATTAAKVYLCILDKNCGGATRGKLNGVTNVCECKEYAGPTGTQNTAPSSGAWSGLSCGDCKAGYSGPDCKCYSGCGGHGVCGGTEGCVCHDDDTNGHWTRDDKGSCTVCKDGWGYADRGCKCRLTNGVACSGHGTCASSGCQCNDGVTSGSKVDHSLGHWTTNSSSPIDCDLCKAGWGPSRSTSPNTKCRVLLSECLVAIGGAPHVEGCLCHRNPSTGYWAPDDKKYATWAATGTLPGTITQAENFTQTLMGPSCTICFSIFRGIAGSPDSGCGCPTLGSDAPCAPFGNCAAVPGSVSSATACACQTNWDYGVDDTVLAQKKAAGLDTTLTDFKALTRGCMKCATGFFGVEIGGEASTISTWSPSGCKCRSKDCSGHGKCTTTGCQCNNNFALGYWAAANVSTSGDCSVCQANAGPAGSCKCKSENCDGHGVCTADGCVCFQSVSDGFWTGQSNYQAAAAQADSNGIIDAEKLATIEKGPKEDCSQCTFGYKLPATGCKCNAAGCDERAVCATGDANCTATSGTISKCEHTTAGCEVKFGDGTNATTFSIAFKEGGLFSAATGSYVMSFEYISPDLPIHPSKSAPVGSQFVDGTSFELGLTAAQALAAKSIRDGVLPRLFTSSKSVPFELHSMKYVEYDGTHDHDHTKGERAGHVAADADVVPFESYLEVAFKINGEKIYTDKFGGVINKVFAAFPPQLMVLESDAWKPTFDFCSGQNRIEDGWDGDRLVLTQRICQVRGEKQQFAVYAQVLDKDNRLLVGIIAGVVLFILLVVVIIVTVCMRRRLKRLKREKSAKERVIRYIIDHQDTHKSQLRIKLQLKPGERFTAEMAANRILEFHDREQQKLKKYLKHTQNKQTEAAAANNGKVWDFRDHEWDFLEACRKVRGMFVQNPFSREFNLRPNAVPELQQGLVELQMENEKLKRLLMSIKRVGDK